MYEHYFEQMECFIKWELPVRKFQPQMQVTELEQLWANLSKVLAEETLNTGKIQVT